MPRTFNNPDALTLLELAWRERKSNSKGKAMIRALLQNGADPYARHVIDPEYPADTTGPEHFPAELTKLVPCLARDARVATAVALQKQKLPYDLMEMIQGY